MSLRVPIFTRTGMDPGDLVGWVELHSKVTNAFGAEFDITPATFLRNEDGMRVVAFTVSPRAAVEASTPVDTVPPGG